MAAPGAAFSRCSQSIAVLAHGFAGAHLAVPGEQRDEVRVWRGGDAWRQPSGFGGQSQNAVCDE